MKVFENSFDSITSNLGIDFGSITLMKVVPAILLLIICLIVIKIALKVLDKFLNKSKIEETLHSFIRSIFKFVLLLIMILLVAASIGINITSMVALIGVVGLAVSLAVQGALSNIAGGIMVLASKPFKVGDYIMAGDTEGTVKEIGLVHTQLLTVDNKLIFIPNADISASRIVNFTHETKRRVDLTITASYDASIESVYKALFEAIGNITVLKFDTDPFVKLSAYLDSSIEYTIRVWAKTEDYWTAHYSLMQEIKKVFDKYGIEMTYKHLNVHMMGKQIV